MLGTTPKAIRHYEKLGLLDRPERSGSGYRLYTASDLLRLNRIRKLRSLGLSLGRIEGILGDDDSGIEFEGVLEALLGEVEGEIERLEKRRANLRRMLREDDKVQKEVPLPEEEPYAFVVFREHLGDRWSSLDPRMLQQMRELWSTLDAFEWPQGYREFQESLARYMADHPGECERLVALEERLAVLAHLPEDSGEVELLAGEYAEFFAQSALPEEVFGQMGGVEDFMGGMGEIFSGVVLDALYPAQKRCIELFIERFSPGDTR